MSVHSQVDAPLSQITTKSIAQIPCRTWNLPFQHAKIMGLAHLTKLTSVSVIHDVETSLEVPTFFGIKLSFPPIFWYDFCPPITIQTGTFLDVKVFALPCRRQVGFFFHSTGKREVISAGHKGARLQRFWKASSKIQLRPKKCPQFWTAVFSGDGLIALICWLVTLVIKPCWVWIY